MWGAMSSGSEETDSNRAPARSLGFLQLDPRAQTSLNRKNIESVACNSRGAIFLSAEGLLFACGNDLSGRHGFLGLGEVYHQPTPAPVLALRKQKIRQVSLGPTHACALTIAGNLFTWGSNACGQLGVADCPRSSIPLAVECAKLFNSRQAVCGPNSTIVVTSNSPCSPPP